MNIGQWLEDFRWAMNAKRARAFRRDLMFSQRQVFDAALRPPVDGPNVIAYPDAFYHMKIDDVCRALLAAKRA